MNVEVFTQIGNLLVTLIPGANVVRGQVNRVPSPAGPHIRMQPSRQVRLATNETSYNGVNQKTLTNFKRFDIQIDFYGPDSADQANTFTTVFRDDYAVNQMGPLVTPLYCSDEIEAPLTNEEKQYEERWMVIASVEFNPDVVLPQDFMDEAEIVLVNVEATYQ